ncbi:hypothetical protein V8C35DRAFT_284037 [Trichoderma chlorosporum]
MENDVTDLMIPPTSSEDERKHLIKDAGAIRCLLLDTVMQGRKRESQSRFLQMPAEILADITDLLAEDKPTLASLALVNSDCRYLARSSQFAEIHFDYSIQAQQLLRHLALEIQHEADVTTRTFPIGVCIRKFTFASLPKHVIRCHQQLYNSEFDSWERPYYSDEQREALQQEAREYYGALRDTAASVIAHAMPNLEILNWEDLFLVDDKFFTDISRCSAHHVKIRKVIINKPWPMEPPLTPALWPLRSLDLTVGLSRGFDTSQHELEVAQESTSAGQLDNPISIFFETLFKRCAATLESLSWQEMNVWSDDKTSLSPDLPSFPRLRYLRLGYDLLSPPASSLLLSSALTHLELPPNLEELGKSLAICEPLRNLQSLIISALPTRRQTCMHVAEFIRQHKHVHKLCVEGYDTSYLNSLIIPVLAEGGFDNLRCISLAWGGDDLTYLDQPYKACIPETSLKTLGTIISLERLSLRIGRYHGLDYQWFIDHKELRQSLWPLSRLKMLALVHDTYAIPLMIPRPIELERHHTYYNARIVGSSEGADARARPNLDMGQCIDDCDNDKIWERAHRNRMLSEAEAYAAFFPVLEWIYCGQRPMGFQGGLESHLSHKEAIPLTQHRDLDGTILDKTFGMR